jgi:hypothetical protein
MGTSTVSGPFRSQNGFQELVNGVWTPVGGGGGGGGGGVVDVITLVDDSQAGAFAGFTCNSYSEDITADPPTGPSAGNIIQLPSMGIGQAVLVNFQSSGGYQKCWALKMPNIAGIDVSYLANNGGLIAYTDPFTGGGNPEVNVIYNVFSTNPEDPIPGIVYIYAKVSTPFYIARTANWNVSGFGPIATFAIVGNITNVPTNEFGQTPPFDQYPAYFGN